MYTNCKCSFIQEDDEPTDWREICEDFEIQVVTDTDSDICNNYTGNDEEEMKKEKNKKKCNRISSDSETDEETKPMKKNKIISDSSDSEVKQGEKSEIDIVSEAKEGEKKSEIFAAKLRKLTYLTDRKFKCPDCDFVGKSTGKVYSHMVDAHGMANFTCDYCKFTTKNKTSFYNHSTKYCRGRKQEHTDENKPQIRKLLSVSNGNFKCPDCDYVGKSTGKVYSHMVDAHGMANFTCDYCKFTTKNKTSFYNHNTRYCRKLKK